MIHSLTLDELKSHLDFFKSMYDAVRLVDPVEKIVLEYRGSERFYTDEVCFNYWEAGKICDNCISIRAHSNRQCYMKLEQSADVIMMVTAIPIENVQSPVVLELLKNATETMLFGEGAYPQGRMMKDVVIELNNLITKDELTGLYNRRYVDERLPVDIIKTTCSNLPLSLAFVDVDNLKRINDVYGHTTGDTILASIAAVMTSCIRAGADWVARYGGDEFLVCLNNTSYEEAEKVLSRIRSKILEIDLPRNEEITGSVSYGLYTMHHEQLTAEALISLADQRMYQAKKGVKTGN